MKKKILCIFCLAFVCFSTFCSEDSLDWNISLLNGIIVTENYFDVRVYYEGEKKHLEEFTHGLKTWATRVHAFDCFSLGVGNFSQSGVWSKFKNPTPNFIAPLKEPFAISKSLISVLPTSIMYVVFYR